MYIIGLTGGTGSGKGVVSASLKKRNGYVIDCDKIAHEIIAVGMPAYYELVKFFGNDILSNNNGIDRKKLADTAFSNKEKHDFLNECTHKYICIEIYKNIEIAKNSNGIYKFVVIDAPLLIEGGLIDICDTLWVVYADKEVRLKRIMERDNITYEQGNNRISMQMDWDELKNYADEIIDNSNGIDEVESQVEKLFLKISL